MESPSYKWMLWGYPYFRKPSFSNLRFGYVGNSCISSFGMGFKDGTSCFPSHVYFNVVEGMKMCNVITVCPECCLNHQCCLIFSEYIYIYTCIYIYMYINIYVYVYVNGHFEASIVGAGCPSRSACPYTSRANHVPRPWPFWMIHRWTVQSSEGRDADVVVGLVPSGNLLHH